MESAADWRAKINFVQDRKGEKAAKRTLTEKTPGIKMACLSRLAAQKTKGYYSKQKTTP